MEGRVVRGENFSLFAYPTNNTGFYEGYAA
jgi:hypothetical protein